MPGEFRPTFARAVAHLRDPRAHTHARARAHIYTLQSLCVSDKAPLYFLCYLLKSVPRANSVPGPPLSSPFIVFSKYTDPICIFNQCSDRVQPGRCSCRSLSFDLPRDPLPRDEFDARGPFQGNSIFAISPDCRQNRERRRGLVFFLLLKPPIDLSGLSFVGASRSVRSF